MRRVVVTGIGLVTPLGMGREITWRNLIAGKSGIRAITHIPVEDIPCRIAGVVPREEGVEGSFNPDVYMPKPEQRRVADFIIYGMAAATEAIEDSGWKPQSDEERERTGVLIGAGIGGLDRIYTESVTLFENGPRRVSP
ncbi:MAG: beta-ketoacyl synthase N-terminal-like domain-containing protein, partial [Holosporales bacterium]